MNTMKPTPPSHRSRDGFTLLELLTAVAIAAVLFIMLLNIFGQTTKAWSAAEAQVETFQTGRAILDLLARDLAQSRVCSNYPIAGTSNSLSFFAANAGTTNRSDLSYVGYGYNSTDGSLVRTNTIAGNTYNAATDLGTIVMSNLVSFSFQYYYNTSPGNLSSRITWPPPNDTNAPAAVLVTFGLLDTRSAAQWWATSDAFAKTNIANANLRTFQEMIYLPCSQP